MTRCLRLYPADGSVYRSASDAVYHNARGTVALTGYDGILGYRTDGDYKTREDLTDDQVAWLDAHPDFDWDKECEEAKKVADAIKADGWTFASHTWGHIRVGDNRSRRSRRIPRNG